MNLNFINNGVGVIGVAVNWFVKKIPLIILLIGLYYLGKFGWRSYKKYIFGTEHDFLSKYLIRMGAKEDSNKPV